MTEYDDQLKQWWDNADPSAPERGDLVIEDLDDGDYAIRKWPGDMRKKLSYVRVLRRANQFSWQDAPAVIASYGSSLTDSVWVRDPNDGTWIEPWSGFPAVSSELFNVTPLIPAVVTDEMLLRALNHDVFPGEQPWALSDVPGEVEHIRSVLTSAMGL